MTRATLSLAASLLLGISPTPEQQRVFRSTTNGVIVNVAVLDGRKGVPGLTRTDFELRDNGVLQEIQDLTRDRLPLDITFTLDMSGSITPGQHEDLLRAIRQVADTLQQEDRYRVITFNRRVREFVGWRSATTPLDLTDAQPAPKVNDLDTSVFDALALSLLTRQDGDRRQLAIVLTDAYENASFLDGNRVVEAVKYSEAVLDVLVARQPDGRSSPSPDALTRSAANTGGRQIDVGDGGVGAAFLTAIDEFRTSYVLRYTPTGVSPTGWHDLSVKVKNARFEVRARKGYDAGR